MKQERKEVETSAGSADLGSTQSVGKQQIITDRGYGGGQADSSPRPGSAEPVSGPKITG